MLNESTRQEIEAVIGHAEYKRGAASDVLKIVQHHHGWVSDEHLKEAAGLLALTPCELDSIATFYSGIYRRPVGRHVITLCDSVSCWIMGYNPIREHLSVRLGIRFGETTSDGRFTMLPCACLGVCEKAPAMMIDGDVHGDLTPEKTDGILERYA